MRERLTYSTAASGTDWRVLLPLTALICAALHFLRLRPAIHDLPLPAVAWDVYARLNDWHSLHLLQAGALLGLLALSGQVTIRLLPSKSPAAHVHLARLLGICAGFACLLPRVPALLQADVSVPAWTLAMASVLGFTAAPTERRSWWKPLLTGIAAGTALGLDPSTACPLLPAALWRLVGQFRGKYSRRPLDWLWLPALTGILLWIDPGFLTGAPVLAVLQTFPAPSPLEWSLMPFFLLGALVLALRPRPDLLWIPVTAGLLLVLHFPGISVDLSTRLSWPLRLLAGWIIAYGGFRLARGIENGLRQAHRKAAERVPDVVGVALLLGFGLWTLPIW